MVIRQVSFSHPILEALLPSDICLMSIAVTKATTPQPPEAAAPAAAASTPPAAQPVKNNMFQDFFESIEQEQQTMFNPQSNSPTATYFQQHAAYNPFVARQITYPPPGTAINGSGPFLQPQVTGFAAFGGMQQQPFAAPSMQMQPQPTGYNPFRASLGPMPTGFSSSPFMSPPIQATPFALGPQATGASPFAQMQQPTGFGTPAQQAGPFAPQASPWPSAPTSSSPAAASQPPSSFFGSVAAPATSTSPFRTSSPMSMSPAPLAPQPTGSRNPFAPAPGTAPAVPAVPTQYQPSLNALAAAAFSMPQQQQQPQQQPQQQQQQQARTSSPFGTANGFQTARPSSAGPAFGTSSAGIMSSVASSFAFSGNQSASTPNPTSNSTPLLIPLSSPNLTTPSSSTWGGSNAGALSPAADSRQGPFNFGSSPLVPQRTGFGGSTVKPFQPSSSFGTELAQSLPPVPEVGDAPQTSHQPSSFAPNPFRASSMGLSSNSTGVSSQPTGTSFGTDGLSAFSTPFGRANSSFGGSAASGPSLFGSTPSAPPGQSAFSSSPFNQSARQPSLI